MRPRRLAWTGRSLPLRPTMLARPLRWTALRVIIHQVIDAEATRWVASFFSGPGLILTELIERIEVSNRYPDRLAN